MEICREAAQLGIVFLARQFCRSVEWCGRLHNIMAESFLCQVNSPFQASYHVFEVTATANRAVKIG